MKNNLLVRYFIAVVVTYLITVILVSQLNANSIIAMGVELSVQDRLTTARYDLLGMAMYYLPIIALSLMIAFILVSKVLSRFFDKGALLYVLSGFVSIAVMHIVLKHVFSLSVFVLNPETLGLILQCMAGSFGAWIFFYLGKSEQV